MKSGLKFGGDFLIYKNARQGETHSESLVVLEQDCIWARIVALSRVLVVGVCSFFFIEGSKKRGGISRGSNIFGTTVW